LFVRRLQWLSSLLGLLAIIIVARLVDIQVVRAAGYETLADRLLTRPTTYLPAPRGAIHDRLGRIVVSDVPTSDIGIHYALLPMLLSDPGQPPPAESREYLQAIARQLRRQGRFQGLDNAAALRELIAEVDAMWPRLCMLTSHTRPELQEEARRIRARVEAIKQVVTSRNATIRAINEERAVHALIHAVEPALAVAVRVELERPWLRVIPSSRRVAHDADSLVHVLGRVGEASPARIEADLLRDDEFRRLAPGDLCGVSGVERLAELQLRGRRGKLTESIDRVVEEHVEPVQGDDVRLSIDLALQDFCLARLKGAVDASEYPAGGAVVVLDARTREVLALASYPTYAYDRYGRDYDRLRADARWIPLRSHALQNAYPPGSTCKVIALYGGLAEGVVAPGTSVTCDGAFREKLQNSFRCWIFNQFGSTHGPQSASDAIRNSCNIFFFTCGDRLGPERLTEWFRNFGMGRPAGTGLIEESAGVVPTAAWLARNRPDEPTFQTADAWNFAIGQGEISATPLQCANVAATIATGRWAPVKLAFDRLGANLSDATEPARELDAALLRPIREGMWRVVNEPGGTAHRAKLEHPDHVLLGKTGSAQTAPRAISRRWFLRWSDGREESRVGPIEREDFMKSLPDGERPEVVGYRTEERFPSLGDKLPAHAWFIGYTQHKDTRAGERARGETYAICVLIEFAGSGGQVASPVAKDVAEHLLSQQDAWGRGAGGRLRLAGR
jgi:cell division protein FtsI/penicillin-binding protein 2